MLGSEYSAAVAECPRGLRGSARERLNVLLAAELNVSSGEPMRQEWEREHERRAIAPCSPAARHAQPPERGTR